MSTKSAQTPGFIQQDYGMDTDDALTVSVFVNANDHAFIESTRVAARGLPRQVVASRASRDSTQTLQSLGPGATLIDAYLLWGLDDTRAADLETALVYAIGSGLADGRGAAKVHLRTWRAAWDRLGGAARRRSTSPRRPRSGRKRR